MKKEIFFYILGFLVLVSASNTGNEVEWDDAPYMVKVRLDRTGGFTLERGMLLV